MLLKILLLVCLISVRNEFAVIRPTSSSASPSEEANKLEEYSTEEYSTEEILEEATLPQENQQEDILPKDNPSEENVEETEEENTPPEKDSEEDLSEENLKDESLNEDLSKDNFLGETPIDENLEEENSQERNSAEEILPEEIPPESCESQCESGKCVDNICVLEDSENVEYDQDMDCAEDCLDGNCVNGECQQDLKLLEDVIEGNVDMDDNLDSQGNETGQLLGNEDVQVEYDKSCEDICIDGQCVDGVCEIFNEDNSSLKETLIEEDNLPNDQGKSLNENNGDEVNGIDPENINGEQREPEFEKRVLVDEKNEQVQNEDKINGQGFQVEDLISTNESLKDDISIPNDEKTSFYDDNMGEDSKSEDENVDSNYEEEIE